MKTRDLILPFGLAAALFVSAPALRAQAPAAEHASPGDHGQDRGLDREAAPGVKSRTLHEAQPETAKPGAEPVSHEHEVKLLGFAFGSLGQWILQLINLALFGGALWYLVKGPVKAAFAGLRKDLEDQLRS